MGGKTRGFTLIELLIVVAIIAILAAIAVPNFLEAQTRAKISRTKADLRTLAVALEAYAIDHNDYPPERGDMNNLRNFVPLSTPIAYIGNPLLVDPFIFAGSRGSNNHKINVYSYFPMWIGIRRGRKFTRRETFHLVNGHDLAATPYADDPDSAFDPSPYVWVLAGYGGDRVLQFDNDPAIRAFPHYVERVTAYNVYMPYDATNGTVSEGDIFRLGP